MSLLHKKLSISCDDTASSLQCRCIVLGERTLKPPSWRVESATKELGIRQKEKGGGGKERRKIPAL